MKVVDEPLSVSDPKVHELVRKEERRQADKIRLIPSENYVSRAVLEASGSIFINKYSEGYAQKRYYEGQQNVDPLEALAQERACALFGAEHANVQPYSGSPANLAVYLAFLKPGDKVMGLALPMGGHLTHGWNVSITGKFFQSVQYGVRKDTGRIDMDEVRDLARRERPLLIWAGGTAYSRHWDFAAFAEIAKEVGARFAVDMAHIAGLIAGGAHPTPIPVCRRRHDDHPQDPARSTRWHDSVQAAVCVPNRQGGIPRAAGRPARPNHRRDCRGLNEAAQPAFKQYAHNVVANAKTLAAELMARGFHVFSGGTDNHLILIDLTNKNVPGKIAAKALDKAGLELNYNSVPYDTRKPFDPSGIRLGTPSVTSRGMGETGNETHRGMDRPCGRQAR
jgi:glycine hydroxymethyltransferase